MSTRAQILQIVSDYVVTNNNEQITASEIKEILDLIINNYFHHDDTIDIGFAPEMVANKATTFILPNNTSYPSTLAVYNEIVSQITSLINGSPSNLNTLKEIADAIGNDPNFITTITNSLATKEVTSNKATDLSSNDNQHYPTTKAVKDAITNAVTGLLDYRGGFDASINSFPTTGGSGDSGVLLKGDFWFCTVAGTLGGIPVKVGDMIISKVDTPAQTSSNWDIVSTELGFTPENSSNKDTDGTLSSNSDTKYPSQKAVKTYADTKQSALGFTPENVSNKDTDGTLASNSDTKYPSQKAVKTYADTKQSALGFTPENVSNKDTDGTLSSNSDIKYPSQKAVKTYADTKQSALGFTPENVSNKATDLTSYDNTHYPTTKAVQDAITNAVAGLLDYRGGYNASVNTFPTTGGSGTSGALLKGDFWFCTVAGTLGGTTVKVGDMIISKVDSPAQTSSNWDLISTELGYTSENVSNKDASGGYVGLTSFKTNFWNLLGTVKSFFTNSNTAVRTYFFQDRDGTIPLGVPTVNNLAKGNSNGDFVASQINDNGSLIGIGISSIANTFVGIYNTTQLYANYIAHFFSSSSDKIGSYTDMEATGTGQNFGHKIYVTGSTTNNFGYYSSVVGANAKNVGGYFGAGGATLNYALQLQDGYQGVGKFLRSVDADGNANWGTINDYDVDALPDASNDYVFTWDASAGLMKKVLLSNLPGGSSSTSSSVFSFNPNEVWRGSIFANNSTTLNTENIGAPSATASVLAQSVGTTDFHSKQIRLRYYQSVIASGHYCGVRGTALLWYVGAGFRFCCSFNVSDTVYSSGSRQFYGLAGQTTDLGYTDTINVASLTNIIGVGSESTDANLQFFYNDATGTASKIDLGSSFPANRTSGAIMTTFYEIQIVNQPNSNIVYYKVTNKETGVSVNGSVSTDLPATTQGLNYFASRCLGGGGGLTNAGQFDLSGRFGVYSPF